MQMQLGPACPPHRFRLKLKVRVCALVPPFLRPTKAAEQCPMFFRFVCTLSVPLPPRNHINNTKMPVTRLAGTGAAPTASVGASFRAVLLPLRASVVRPWCLGSPASFPGVCGSCWCFLVGGSRVDGGEADWGGEAWRGVCALLCPEFDAGGKLSACVRMLDVRD